MILEDIRTNIRYLVFGFTFLLLINNSYASNDGQEGDHLLSFTSIPLNDDEESQTVLITAAKPLNCYGRMKAKRSGYNVLNSLLPLTVTTAGLTAYTVLTAEGWNIPKSLVNANSAYLFTNVEGKSIDWVFFAPQVFYGVASSILPEIASDLRFKRLRMHNYSEDITANRNILKMNNIVGALFIVSSGVMLFLNYEKFMQMASMEAFSSIPIESAVHMLNNTKVPYEILVENSKNSFSFYQSIIPNMLSELAEKYPGTIWRYGMLVVHSPTAANIFYLTIPFLVVLFNVLYSIVLV